MIVLCNRIPLACFKLVEANDVSSGVLYRVILDLQDAHTEFTYDQYLNYLYGNF